MEVLSRIWSLEPSKGVRMWPKAPCGLRLSKEESFRKERYWHPKEKVCSSGSGRELLGDFKDSSGERDLVPVGMAVERV